MTPVQQKAADKAAQLLANATPVAPVVAASTVPTKLVTLNNAENASEVLQSVISIMKSKAQISADQIDRTLVFRVIGNGNLVTRKSGDVTMLYNTNATTPALLAKATAMIEMDAFLALDLASAKEDAKAILNSCSISFSADLSVAISKNDEVKCKPVNFITSTGEQGIGLNFVGIQQAEVAKKGDTSALDALLATIKG